MGALSYRQSSRSDILVNVFGRFVHGMLHRVLGVADGLLRMALQFLRRTFGTKLVGADGLADAFA